MEKEEKKKEIKETKEVKESKKLKPLVTCRVLFVSVLDKIYLGILLIMLVVATYNNFNGEIGSLDYGFFTRVWHEVWILVVIFIAYLFLNWLYKCVLKTMLCLTGNEVYKEKYVPFKRGERSIPLNKITAVDTYNFFWIFRCVSIHQYGRFPMIFFTWNNQEFKDKLTELITKDKEKVLNEAEEKNMINKEQYKYLKYLGIGLLAIIVLVGIVRFFSYLGNEERKLAGTYSYKKDEIVLFKNGNCDIDDVRDKVISCDWSYDKENKNVIVAYEYKSSYYYGTYTGSLTLDYDKSKKSLTLDDVTYKK